MKCNVVLIFLGDVVLTDLKLKDTCLDNLDLPIRTIYGHLGKILKVLFICNNYSKIFLLIRLLIFCRFTFWKVLFFIIYVIGKLVLKIPWKNIYSGSVEASIDSLFLLVVPTQDISYDVEKEEKNKQTVKQNQILKIEYIKLLDQQRNRMYKYIF